MRRNPPGDSYQRECSVLYATIREADRGIAFLGDRFIVRNHHDRQLFRTAQFGKGLENFLSVFRVQIASRFIRQEQ